MPDAQRWRYAHPSHGATSLMTKLNVLLMEHSSCVNRLPPLSKSMLLYSGGNILLQ